MKAQKILAVPEFLSHDYLYNIININKNDTNKAREMDQQLRVHAVHA